MGFSTINHHLVGGINPSENNESVGIMTFPIMWNNKSDVPDHQSTMYQNLGIFHDSAMDNDEWGLHGMAL